MIYVLTFLIGFCLTIFMPDILFAVSEKIDEMKFKRGYEERTIVREDMYVGDGRWTIEMQNYARCKVKITEFKNKTNYPNWTHKRQEIIEQGEWISIKDFKTDGLTRTNYGIV